MGCCVSKPEPKPEPKLLPPPKRKAVDAAAVYKVAFDKQMDAIESHIFKVAEEGKLFYQFTDVPAGFIPQVSKNLREKGYTVKEEVVKERRFDGLPDSYNAKHSLTVAWIMSTPEIKSPPQLLI